MPEKNLEENKNYANNKFQLIATMIVTIALTSVSPIQAAPTVSSNPSEEAKNSVTTNDIARTFNNPVPTSNPDGTTNTSVPTKEIAKTFVSPGNNTNPASPK